MVRYVWTVTSLMYVLWAHVRDMGVQLVGDIGVGFSFAKNHLFISCIQSSFIYAFADITKDTSVRMKDTVDNIINLIGKPRNYGNNIHSIPLMLNYCSPQVRSCHLKHRTVFNWNVFKFFKSKCCQNVFDFQFGVFFITV